FEPGHFTPDPRQHPDARLGLQPSDTIKQMRDALQQSDTLNSYKNIVWCLSLLVIFFAIHVLRTGVQWTFVGLIAPFVAVLGDALTALLLGIVLLLPLRLLWRAVSRPMERVAWHRFDQLNEQVQEPTPGERVLKFWLESRMKLAMELRQMGYSLNFAFWRLLRLGLPLTAILIAINFIWGFSWYFNSENWASAVWQEATKARVDVWREQQAEAVEQLALANGVAPEQVFAIEPEGVTDTGDFSFVVIGDTGEGDPSQRVLRNQLIAASNREQVKFLVLSSDVIYPDGKMKDYETNFYLPFHGFEKPIYAIPGNHDWFDANEGFNANFFEPDAALLALQTRLAADLGTDAFDDSARLTELVDEAQRLRDYYGIQNGRQRAPFFEMHTADFSLIAIDTGILRRVDPKEMAWLESALERAGDNFKMVVIGHPMYAAGIYQGENDPTFDEMHTLLQRHQVAIVMAGDTHDFEFYREKYGANGQDAEMLHFVNGGGGAYLSIGTVLDFPDSPAVEDYAFYPRTDELAAKMENETPLWQRPFLLWLNWFNGYPVSAEWLSGVFDFNRAPFFQSFMEVRVERSQNRVRLLLYGVDGQLRWRDLQLGGQVKPAGQSDDDFVEFIVPLNK
nr:metallophosphoesterase [Anaerolineae bacterium]